MAGPFHDFLTRLRGSSSRQDRDRLAAVLQLNRALAAAEDLRALLTMLLDEAVALFAAERGFVLTPGGGEPFRFAVAAARNLDREAVSRPETKVSATVARRCLVDGESVFSEDAQADDLAAAASIADLKLRSVLCVPLRAGERVVGALYLDHRFHGGAFRREDLPWLEAFADQAAIALELHALLDRVEARRRAAEDDNRRLAAQVVDQERQLSAMASELVRDDLAHDYPEHVGNSPALLRHLRMLDRVAPADFPVLLVGESGCGKELAARAIWRNGGRAAGPFVPVHLAALAPDLMESELFGHVKGAYTGADRDRPGLFREADDGVLFLDEVTEMPLEVQVKLLRVLEDGRVRPVGGDAAVPVDVRIVAATNRDPLAAVEAGTFREDLYYRLAVVTVPLPPLRERRADVPELVTAFLATAAAARGAPPRRASPELLAALARRTWRGNVRELRNAVFRLDALAEGEEIPTALLEPEPAHHDAVETLDLAALERRTIAAALDRADGNKAEAARLLGISRRSLYDRLRRDPDLAGD